MTKPMWDEEWQAESSSSDEDDKRLLNHHQRASRRRTQSIDPLNLSEEVRVVESRWPCRWMGLWYIVLVYVTFLNDPLEQQKEPHQQHPQLPFFQHMTNGDTAGLVPARASPTPPRYYRNMQDYYQQDGLRSSSLGRNCNLAVLLGVTVWGVIQYWRRRNKPASSTL